MGENVVFRMCLNLNDFQFKTDRYRQVGIYKLHGNHKSKTITDIQNLERKEQKHNTKHQKTTMEETETEEERRTTKTTRKQITKCQ